MNTPPTPEELGERPAYPIAGCATNLGFWTPAAPGMTTRQAYKMSALKGLSYRIIDESQDTIAHWCGALADAMLAEDAARLQRKEGET